MKHIVISETPIGKLYILDEDGEIAELQFSPKISCIDAVHQETKVLGEAIRQLGEYFSGRRKAFDLPIKTHGTTFQQRVWEELQNIPYGETRSYGQIAKAIGCPGGSRAVGMANNRNPIPIIIPCHRVIGANGKLVGYGGGLPIKEYLLQMEKENP